MTSLFGRAVRIPQRYPLANYPPWLRQVMFWYDSLTDWQRVQYAIIAILFLVACGGYLLGLGSTILLQRVEAQEAILAAEPLPTVELTNTAIVVVLPTSIPTTTPQPSPTRLPPTALPTQTPFSAPVIAEPPAAPRVIPAAPVVVAPRATPTVDKPRNLETAKPEPPAASVATPTSAVVRTVRPTAPTAVRQSTPAGTARPTTVATTLPTLALPGTPAPTRRPTTPPTPIKTPGVR